MKLRYDDRKNKSIIVVDDDPDILAGVCDILEDIGFNVDRASNGESAMRLVEKKQYDVALLDFKMPDMDGAELYHRIRKCQSVTVAIMVTAYAGSDGVQRAIDAGTWRVLRKPVDMAKLIDIVETALAQKTVLVVDDDSEFCRSIWDALREHDFRVGVAHSAEQAAEEIMTGRYEVVLLDLRLGDASGIDVLRRLRGPVDLTKVFVVTGVNQDDELVTRLRECGVDNVLYKPIDVGDLVGAISG